MRRAILYVHGKGGSPDEAARFGQLFPGRVVMGLNYRSDTPWDTRWRLAHWRGNATGCH